MEGESCVRLPFCRAQHTYSVHTVSDEVRPSSWGLATMLSDTALTFPPLFYVPTCSISRRVMALSRML